MQTVVIQSYRETGVPAWMTRCRTSVETWAEECGWAYRFLGDELFDLVPDPIRTKFATQRPLLADIARLKWAHQIFEAGAGIERVVWLDADVLVFAPENIEIPAQADFAVGRQVWVQPGAKDKLRAYRQVHNAVLAIRRSSPTLEFLIQEMTTIADRHDGPASPQLLGPKLLTALHNIVGFSVIEGVGMASPSVLTDIIEGGGPALDLLLKESPTALGALNLCSSYRGQTVDEIMCDDALFDAATAALMTTGLETKARLQ